jgi:hypothetical protein
MEQIMKKRDNVRRHKPLLEKNYLKAITTDIAIRFDFNKRSWIAEAIVKKLDNLIESYEKSKGIERLKPGELLLPYKNRLLAIPFLDGEAINIFVDTKVFAAYKKRIINKTLQILKNQDKKANLNDVYSLISPRDTIAGPHHDADIYHSQIDPCAPLINPEHLGIKLSGITPFIIQLPEETKKEIIHFCVNEIGIKPFVASSILKFFLEKRASFLPLMSSLEPGQLNWLATSFKKSRKAGCLQIEREQVPVILTLHTKEELEKKPSTLKELNTKMMRQLARITTEAYLQETLLPGNELQLFYLRSYTVIGKLLRKYMQINKVILPTPGTILDAGTTITHKELIIDLHMKGYYTNEISKKTYHDPRSVDAYIKTFNSILILWYFNLPKSLISMVTERGQRVIQQHLDIITKYFPDSSSVEDYLTKQEISL